MTTAQKKAKRKRVRAIYEGFRWKNQAPARKEKAENQDWFRQFLDVKQ